MQCYIVKDNLLSNIKSYKHWCKASDLTQHQNIASEGLFLRHYALKNQLASAGIK